MSDTVSTRRLEGKLLEECAEWIWEQLQEDGVMMAGELIELVLRTERELAIQHQAPVDIAPVVNDEFKMRRMEGIPETFDTEFIRLVLEWEDEWLGFAGIRRAES